MKTRHLLLGAVALAWIAASPTAGNAASPGWSGGTFCTSGFNACASVWLDVTNDGRTVTLTIQNLSSYNGNLMDNPNTIGFIGLYHIGASAWSGNVTSFSATRLTNGTESDVTAQWTLGGADPLQVELNWGAVAPPPHNGVLLDQTVRFVFELDTSWEYVDNTHASWLHQGDPDSYKNTTVPEPGILALLGAGLMGILGVAGVRRRRNGFEVKNG